MTLRKSFRPLRPDLDGFLFSAVGDERDGVPLSVISALTRLGLDPWDEAGRLSSLCKREAVEQLARLIAESPGAIRPLPEARQLAEVLVEQLPKPGSDASALSEQIQRIGRRSWPLNPKLSQFLAICVIVTVVILFSIVMCRRF